MRQYESISLNGIGRDNPELARELLKIDRYLKQQSHAVTTNALESGQEPSAVSSASTTNIEVKESGVSVSTSIGKFDFLSGFDVSESPSGEANISLDINESPLSNVILTDGSRAFTGNQSMGSNSMTNTTTLEAPVATKLEFVSNETDGASAEAFRFNWDANVATPTNSAKYLSIGFTDDVDAYNEIYSLVHNTTFGALVLADRGTGTFRGGFGVNTSNMMFFNSTGLARFRFGGNNSFELSGTSTTGVINSITNVLRLQSAKTASDAADRFDFLMTNKPTAGDILSIRSAAAAQDFLNMDFNGNLTLLGASIPYSSRDSIRYSLMGA